MKSFYQSNLIVLPRAKIRAGEVKPQMNTEITAGKFLEFAKTVLLKARLTPKARAIVPKCVLKYCSDAFPTKTTALGLRI